MSFFGDFNYGNYCKNQKMISIKYVLERTLFQKSVYLKTPTQFLVSKT